MKLQTYRQFEVGRYRANVTCPCGKDNKKGIFATQKGYKGQPVGHCFSCNQDFWNKNDTKLNFKELIVEDILPLCSCEINQVLETFDTELRSDFAKWICKILGEDEAIKVVERYFLGVDDDNNVIFWQIDRKNGVRTGKVMSYGLDGKRRGVPSWRHQKDCKLNQCFFGEHLIENYDLPLAVVESEKTACLMSYFNPAFIWLACGSAGNLQDWKCVGIEEFEVTLFPDHNQYYSWKKIADRWDFEISRECELWFEQGLIKAKEDIADYYLTLNNLVPLDLKLVKIDNEWSQEEYESIFKNSKKELKYNLKPTIKS